MKIKEFDKIELSFLKLFYKLNLLNADGLDYFIKKLVRNKKAKEEVKWQKKNMK